MFIDWGDHSLPKPGHVHGEGNGQFAVLSAHRYIESGTFPVTTPLFTVLLISVILIVSALTFFPALSLGPILEHLLMNAGKVF